MKISPYHSVKRPVYHVCTNCSMGNKIEQVNLRSGKDGKTLCNHCAGLIKQGRC